METSKIELLKKIIDRAYDVLIQKLAHGGIISKNEASFQLEFAYILKTLGQLYEFKKEDKFHLELESPMLLEEQSLKSDTKQARVDITIEYYDGNKTTKVAIELKFFKKENHREPNNRYDVFADLSNLEAYKRSGCDLCYFILATDHLHYVNQEEYSKATADFDFGDGKEYKAGTELKYNTEKPYGSPIKLTGNYAFKWDHPKDTDFHFLKVQV